jgi:hypothetical protein
MLLFDSVIMSKLNELYNTLKQVANLPNAALNFSVNISQENIMATYRYYTKPHPRYKLIRHKTLGAALIDFFQINTPEKYFALIDGKNGAQHHAKRARARGYKCVEINRNDHIDAIYRINTSCALRQGRPMDAAYQHKIQNFDSLPNFKYFGIVDKYGELVAYANIGTFGNFCSFSQLIGLRNNDGIMHLLVVEIIFLLIDEAKVRYVMYDTFFGALPGLRLFKKMLGFRPYRVKYTLQ